MAFFKKNTNNLIEKVQEPSSPWGQRVVVSAAGVTASGWTLNNKVFLYSSDGYSVSDPETGTREIRNYDKSKTAYQKFSKDNLEFTIDELTQTIKVFGIWGGDGNHYTTDLWHLVSFSPSLGEQIIGLQNPTTKQSHPEYWNGFELILLKRLDYTQLKFGFSPNEKHFGIFGSGGAEIFTRP
jgi:hypothetical protein